MSGKSDKRLHARTQASDMDARWAATFGQKGEVRQADPETCAHNHLSVDMYAEAIGIVRFYCARCGSDRPR